MSRPPSYAGEVLDCWQGFSDCLRCVGAGWTLGVGWGQWRGSKVPANYSLTSGKPLASRRPKKLEFCRQRPQCGQRGTNSAGQRPPKFPSPRRHRDGVAEGSHILWKINRNSKLRYFIATCHPFPTGTGRGFPPSHRQKRDGIGKIPRFAQRQSPKRADAGGITAQQYATIRNNMQHLPAI